MFWRLTHTRTRTHTLWRCGCCVNHLGFTFLGKRGVKDMQSMKSSLFQFKAVQRSGARHIPHPQHSNLRI